jgi:hypothetical protein
LRGAGECWDEESRRQRRGALCGRRQQTSNYASAGAMHCVGYASRVLLLRLLVGYHRSLDRTLGSFDVGRESQAVSDRKVHVTACMHINIEYENCPE